MLYNTFTVALKVARICTFQKVMLGFYILFDFSNDLVSNNISSKVAT